MLFFCSNNTSVFASDDFQYWSRATLKTLDNDKFSLATYGEGRMMEDAGEARFYLISEQMAYHWLEYLDLGLNYTYLENKVSSSTTEDQFKYQHRLELEMNPHWSLTDWLDIKNRNRVEFRWIEDQGSDNTRFRQLLELYFPLKNTALFKGFYLNDEYFYDFRAEKITENRFIPVGVDFKISGNVSLKIFYMLQALKRANDWSSDQIVGTHVTISF